MEKNYPTYAFLLGIASILSAHVFCKPYPKFGDTGSDLQNLQSDKKRIGGDFSVAIEEMRKNEQS